MPVRSSFLEDTVTPGIRIAGTFIVLRQSAPSRMAISSGLAPGSSLAAANAIAPPMMQAARPGSSRPNPEPGAGAGVGSTAFGAGMLLGASSDMSSFRILRRFHARAVTGRHRLAITDI